METNNETLLRFLQSALIEKSTETGSTYRKVRSDYMRIIKNLKVLVPELLVRDIIDIILNTETMQEVEAKIENIFNSDNYTTVSANVFKLAEMFSRERLLEILDDIFSEEANGKVDLGRILLNWNLYRFLFSLKKTAPP